MVYVITLYRDQANVWRWRMKAKDPRRDLVRAAALLLAEIERLDRAAAPSVPVQGTKT